jgi:hypothetical protein
LCPAHCTFALGNRRGRLKGIDRTGRCAAIRSALLWRAEDGQQRNRLRKIFHPLTRVLPDDAICKSDAQ